jgi:hypothetical protein
VQRPRPVSRTHACSLVAALVLGAVSATPNTAHAWTKTIVRDLAAQVTIDEGGHAHAELTIGIEVLGGWLAEFEVSGLGEGAKISTGSAPRLRSTDDGGFAATPEAEFNADEQTLALRFDRKGAPRAGLYELTFAYDVPLAFEAKTSAVEYRLPAWEVGLDSIEVRVTAPEDSVALLESDAERDGRVLVQTTLAQGRTTFVWSRAHLPRLTAWPLRVRLARGVAQGGAGTASGTPPGSSPEDRADSFGGTPGEGRPRARLAGVRDEPIDVALPWAVALLVLLAAAGNMRGHALAAQRRDARPVAVVALPRITRITLVGAFALLGGWGWEFHTLLSAGAFALAVLIAWERSASPAVKPAPLGRWRSPDAVDMARAASVRRFVTLGLENPFDGTTVIGAAFAFLFVLLAVVSAEELRGLWIFPALCLFAGTRFALPKTTEEALLLLPEARRRAGLESLDVALFESASGMWLAARLRRAPSARERTAGLEAVEARLVESPGGAPRLDTTVSTAAGSPAECVLRTRAIRLAEGGNRVLWRMAPGAGEASGNEVESLARALAGLGAMELAAMESDAARAA